LSSIKLFTTLRIVSRVCIYVKDLLNQQIDLRCMTDCSHIKM